MSTNLRIRDVREGDLLEVDGRPARVSCAMILDDDVIIVLDDAAGGHTALTEDSGAVKLISRPADTIAGAADTIVTGR